ncbi:GTP cyclohydrolase, partial [bacterium]
MITIKAVVSKNDIGDFIQVPFYIYKFDDNWVAPLRADEFKKLDRKRHPFYDHAEAELFVARKGRKPVGRIAAIVDRLF